MIIAKKYLSRRTLLRGLGAALALPLLDAMVPALTLRAHTAAKPIRRFGFVYVPNGMMMDEWTPSTEGVGFEFSRILKPVEPFRDQLNVLSGLTRFAQGMHAGASTTWLVPDPEWDGPKRKTVYLDGSSTVDQVLAKHLGQYTQFGSLELALEGAELVGNCCEDYSCAYTNTVSWRDATTPLPMETNPRSLFERLFGDGSSTSLEDRQRYLEEDRSLLDAVTRDVADLRGSLGPTDRNKLEQYLDAVRDVERRIQLAEQQSTTSTVPTIDRPIGIPDRFEDHAKLMFDLQLLAYQLDLTRVITFMLGREISNRSYPEIGVPEPHHSTSHHQYDPEKIEKNARINTLHVKLFAHFLESLRATAEGDGTLLDSAVLLYGAGLSDPNSHVLTNQPVMIAGGAGGQIKGGRHIRYSDQTNTPQLIVTLMEKMGVPMDLVTDNVRRLERLPGL